MRGVKIRDDPLVGDKAVGGERGEGIRETFWAGWGLRRMLSGGVLFGDSAGEGACANGLLGLNAGETERGMREGMESDMLMTRWMEWTDEESSETHLIRA